MKTIAKNTFRFPNIPLLPEIRFSDTYTIDLHLSLNEIDEKPVLLVRTLLTPTGSHVPAISTDEPNIAIDMLRGAYPNDKYIDELTYYLATYDKNHMHAGTYRQEQAIKNALSQNILGDRSQTEIMNYLKSIQLYVDDSVRDADGSPHRYGHGWIYASIPESDMRRLRDIIAGEDLPRDIGHIINNNTKE